MQNIVLTTLNARYIHASLGLRYLLANMGALASRTTLLEFTINQQPLEIAEQLLKRNPAIIGFGVYIWNSRETQQVIALIKTLSPEIIIVLGGPEVSHETDRQSITNLADHVIGGPGDTSFRELCQEIASGQAPQHRTIPGKRTPLKKLTLPYHLYSDEDIRNRVLYVEASRGCPFQCEFCLSALDRSSKSFALDRFLSEMAVLYDRGARSFKFVDRTFNLKVDTSIRILDFFLERLDKDLFLHFEVIPDNLSEQLKTQLSRFPKGVLQLEVGIQTFNPEVQKRINRKQDNRKTETNLRWLRQHSGAHIHADLIFGLPGEDLDSFARSFDRLVAQQPHEIQLGILKRLRGAPIIRHSDNYQMRYNPHPPYNILSTSFLDFFTVQKMNRFARYWDMIANSGRFPQTTPLMLGETPFQRFDRLSEWLYLASGQTHGISLNRLYKLLHEGLQSALGLPETAVTESLLGDYRASGQPGVPRFLRLGP